MVTFVLQSVSEVQCGERLDRKLQQRSNDWQIGISFSLSLSNKFHWYWKSEKNQRDCSGKRRLASGDSNGNDRNGNDLDRFRANAGSGVWSSYAEFHIDLHNSWILINVLMQCLYKPKTEPRLLQACQWSLIRTAKVRLSNAFAINARSLQVLEFFFSVGNRWCS